GSHRALARGHQRAQRFPLAAGARLGGPALGEDAPRGSDGVERVVLASRATLPPQPPTSSTRSPSPLRKRLRPAPNEPAPSIANDRRPGAWLLASSKARA